VARQTQRRQGEETPPTAEVAVGAAEHVPSVAADEEAAARRGAPLIGEDDSGRVKLSASYIVSHSVRLLGVASHEMLGALSHDGREELTIDAARKALDQWRGTQQNPTEDEEE
jgi:hypothetical protein